MTLAEAIGVLRRLWYVVLAVALLGVGAGLLIFTGQTTTYRSSVDLVLTPDVASGDSKDVSNALVALDRRTLIGTLAVVAGSGQIRSASIRASGVPEADITAFGGTAVAEANVVTVAVSGRTSSSVEAVTAEAVTEIVDRFEGQYPLYRVEPIDEPVATVVRGAPLWQLVGVGLVAGALVGVLIALFVDAAQRSRIDRDPAVPMGYVAVPVEFVRPSADGPDAPPAIATALTPAVAREPEPVDDRELDADLDLDLVLDLEDDPAPEGDPNEPVVVGAESAAGRSRSGSRARS